MAKEQGGPHGFQMLEEDASEKAKPDASLPSIGFGTFVLSLSTSALVHLGVSPLPGKAEPGEPNLPLAQQTIEILAMLHEKTQGNLDEDEQRLLEAILHDLRMRYVEVHGARNS